MAEEADRTGQEADRRARGRANGRAAQQKTSCQHATRRKAGGRPAAGGTRGGGTRHEQTGRAADSDRSGENGHGDKRTAAGAEKAGGRG